MSNKVGTQIGEFRVVKRNKELFKGYPYYVAIDLDHHPEAWYLRADGTLSVDCCDDAKKVGSNSGWFSTMDEVMAAIGNYRSKKGVMQYA